jgi:hypothetical protein
VIARGQRYRTISPIPVAALTLWAAPFTGGYERMLPAGEEFEVSADPPGTATAVMCDAVDYARLHSQLIPRGDRWRFWSYRGFYLSIQRKDIEKNCELTRPSPVELEFAERRRRRVRR